MGVSIAAASVLSLVPGMAHAETSGLSYPYGSATTGTTNQLNVALDLEEDVFEDAPATVEVDVMTEAPDSGDWTISLWVDGEPLPDTCANATACSFMPVLDLGLHTLMGVVEWGDGERSTSGVAYVQIGPDGSESSGPGSGMSEASDGAMNGESDSSSGGEPGTTGDGMTTGGPVDTSASAGANTTADDDGGPPKGSCSVDPQGRGGSGWLAAGLMLLGAWARRRRSVAL